MFDWWLKKKKKEEEEIDHKMKFEMNLTIDIVYEIYHHLTKRNEII